MAFVIPSIFSAVDRVSNVVRQMTSTVRTYNTALSTGGALSQRQSSFIANQHKWFSKLAPAIGEATKQALGFLKTTALVGGAFALMSFSAGQIKKYEDNLASFRVIVSDLSNSEFDKFKSQIASVANDTKKSTVDVAQAFENIAGLNEKFAKTAEGLGAVSKASITMAKAANMELGPSAESLVGIMNQFNLEALEATRVANVLAAGQAVGAAGIAQSAEAYKNFGAVAAKSNITLEQSQALIQTLASKMIMGAEAGTALRGVTLKMQKANLGYQSGIFKIDDALAQMQGKMAKMRTEQERNAYMAKVFGAENITAGSILLNNINTYKEFTTAVTGTNAAQEAAAIQSSTLSAKIEELKARWTNLITASDGATTSLQLIKVALAFVTDHMDTLIVIGGSVLGLFILWKAAIIGTTMVMGLYNVALGVYLALTGKSALATVGNTTAYIAYRAAIMAGTIATGAATAAQWLFNAALTANPIGLVIAAIAALVGVIVLVIKKWDTWGKYVNLLLGPLGFVIELIQSFRRNWDLVSEAFSKNGILAGIKAIGKVLLDAVLSPLQRILELASHLPGKMGEWAKSGADAIGRFRAEMGTSEAITPPVNYNRAPLLPYEKAAVAQMGGNTIGGKNTTNAVELIIKGPAGAVDVDKNKGNVPIKLSPTLGFGY